MIEIRPITECDKSSFQEEKKIMNMNIFGLKFVAEYPYK